MSEVEKKEASESAAAASEVEEESKADHTVKLLSQENEEFEVPFAVAQMSELVKTMTDDGDMEEVPLPNVKSHILAKVLEFCKRHVTDPLPEIEKPLKSNNLGEVVPEWDSKFVEVGQEILFELILAANYMDIKTLMDLSCAKVATMIMGKTPEEIRKQFNIVNDFTPEEEAQIREENKWVEES